MIPAGRYPMRGIQGWKDMPIILKLRPAHQRTSLENAEVTEVQADFDFLIIVLIWEHAYYLKYQYHRVNYIQAFWQIANWQETERRYLDSR